jgi:hypothetical protein
MPYLTKAQWLLHVSPDLTLKNSALCPNSDLRILCGSQSRFQWPRSIRRAGIAGSNPAGGQGCLFVVSVVWCQVEASVTGRSLVQRSPTDRGVPECYLEISPMRMFQPTRAVEP